MDELQFVLCTILIWWLIVDSMLFFPSVVCRPVVKLVPLRSVNYNQLVFNGPTGVRLIVLLVDKQSKPRLLKHYRKIILPYCRYLSTLLTVWRCVGGHFPSNIFILISSVWYYTVNAQTLFILSLLKFCQQQEGEQHTIIRTEKPQWSMVNDYTNCK